MKSTSTLSLSCLLACVGSLLLQTASARACEDARAPRWTPQRSWPFACQFEVPVDGLVLLEGDPLADGVPGGDGELEVYIERIVDEKPVERFTGSLTQPDATSALFRSDRPLEPNAYYILTAQRRSADGAPLGQAFTSAFTTGSSPLTGLSFQGALGVTLEDSEKNLEVCHEDACGERQCEPTGESVPARFLRVAVPALTGGFEQKPYTLTTKLTVAGAPDQAPVVATADSVAMQAGRRSYALIEVPALARDSEGCVTVTATDAAGHTITSEPSCLPLAADAPSNAETPQSAPAAQVDDDDEQLGALALASSHSSATADDAELASISDSAGGCAIGAANRSAGSLGWLALALTLARLRGRRRSA